jgi:hypothetical protein
MVPDSILDEVPTATARRTTGEIELDGVLDDVVWANATPVSGFIQREPVEGIPAEMDTEVRVMFDGTALYIGARMWDETPEAIAAQLVRRDERAQADYLEIYLDPNLDRRTGYVFQVSAANVQGDRYIFNDSEEDSNWNAVWESAVRRDDRGWTLEVRIPLSQIRYDPQAGPQTWGVNFARRRVSSNERSFFSLESRLQRGKVSQFGRLEGMEVPGSARRLEFRPYALSSLASGPAEEGDPFFSGTATDLQAGLDFRWGVTSNFTVDATVNPDFGQVEADPAVINLTAFESFFEEKRPFFVEDARVLDFGLSGRRNALYYSRRIGRAPHGGAPGDAEFEDVPLASKILGAAKVTGRTGGGLSVGALFALTDEEQGRGFFPEDQSVREFVVEPRSEYGVVRIQQDFRSGDTQVGGILAGARRELPGDGSFDWLASTAYSTGLDFEHTWDDRTWALNGFIAAGHIRGDSTAMIRVQRSSNHYYQRPDATWVTMDSTATAMTGTEWRLQFDKRGGQHWTWGIWTGQVTPALEVNDLGFSSNQEKLDAGARVTYREIEPGSVFRNYSMTFTTFHNWSHEALNEPLSLSSWGDAHKSGTVSLRWSSQFLNWWNLELNGGYRPPLYSYTQTRGGPVMVEPTGYSLTASVRTDSRRALSFGPRVTWGKEHNRVGGRLDSSLSVVWRPSARLELRLDPSYARSTSSAQYVTAADTLFYQPTFGKRYLFGELEREQFSLKTRFNVAFSTTLTLEAYAQALLSAGEYASYQQLEAARTYDFDVFERGTYGEDAAGDFCLDGRICKAPDGRQHVDFDGDGRADYDFSDRDFNFRSLRGNLVLRWEYRPGSTVFLVWQHRRSNQEDFGNFDFDRDLRALGTLEGDDLFMVKVNYWLGL